MEELYREESKVSNNRMQFAYIVLGVIALFWIYEGYQFYITRAINVLGWGFNILFVALWTWRVVFKYTYILKTNELEIISHGFLGIKRTYKVDLSKTESYSNKYIKGFFKKTKIHHYIHRYSSVDDNEQRILVFNEGKNKVKLAGVLFKGSERMMRELRKLMPDKFLNLK